MNKLDLLRIQQVHGYPSLTITLPTHRTSPDKRRDRIRLKNLIQQATDRLLNEFTQREIEGLLKRLETLSADVNFRHTLDGLALFVNHDFAEKFYLPFSLPERVAVSDDFVTRDLVFAMNRTPRYWVLVLSEKPTRLFEAERDRLVEIKAEGFPLVHTGPGGEAALPGGFGIKRSQYRDERHRQFFRSVDAALQPFMTDDPLPLAVVGVDRFLAFFDEVTQHKDAILARLLGSHARTTPARLAELVWPEVQAALAAQRRGYLETLAQAVGARRSVSTLGEVWRAAHEGRGELLLVEEDFHAAGRVDESGLHLEKVEDPHAPDVLPDAVDDVIETVLRSGGRVVFTPNGALETHRRIALITRY